MIPLRMIPVVVLLAGCPDLVSQDDPRDDEEVVVVLGHCTGNPVSCSARSVKQCNGGCTTQLMCLSIDLEECANVRDANACDADSSCRWSNGACRARIGEICPIYESATACGNSTLNECFWGYGCTGLTQPCASAKNVATCTVIPGCGWTDK